MSWLYVTCAIIVDLFLLVHLVYLKILTSRAFKGMYLGPLLIILRIGKRKNCPAILKCWQNGSFWKREDKCRKRIELKTVLLKEGHYLALFLERGKKNPKQNTK